MGRSTLYDGFLGFVKAGGLWRRGELVLAAVSGGPDSVALLDILLRYRRRGGIDVAVCHLDHGLRGEDSRADAAFVAELGAKLGIRVEVGRKRVDLFARRRGLCIEAAARAARYEFFAKTARRLGAAKVATAHTASDNAETVLQRMIEGAGPRGLCGIPLVRRLGVRGDVEVVRPLLFATREAIEQYVSARGLSTRLDRSNLEPIYLRNRIRLEILPLLKELNPSIEQALCRVGSAVGELLDFVKEDVAEARREVVRKGKSGGVVLDVEGLARLHAALSGEVVRGAALAAGVDGRALSASHIAGILALARGRRGSGVVELPGGLVARREYGEITIGEPAEGFDPGSFEKPLKVPGHVVLPGEAGRIEAQILKRFDLTKFIAAKSDCEEVVDANAIEGRLTVRFARKGDRLTPLGAPGAKKLQDFFVDAKVARRRRYSVPLVLDEAGIIWAGGIRIADRVKVTEGTESFLRLKWSRRHG